jgi:hypothetical protein
MPRERSHRDRIRVQTSRTRIRILLVLLLVTVIAPMTFYMVREILVGLLLLAVATLTILTFSVALVLSQEGILWAVFWAKTGVTRLARFARLSPETPSLAEKMGEADP